MATGVRELDELDMFLTVSAKSAPKPKPAPKRTEALDVEALLMQLIDEPVKPPAAPPSNDASARATTGPPPTAGPPIPPPSSLPPPPPASLPTPSSISAVSAPVTEAPLPPPGILAPLPPPTELPPPPSTIAPADPSIPTQQPLPPPSLPPPAALPPSSTLPPPTALAPLPPAQLPPLPAPGLPPMAAPAVTKQLLTAKSPVLPAASPPATAKEQVIRESPLSNSIGPSSKATLPPEPARPTPAVSFAESSSTAAAMITPSPKQSSQLAAKNERLVGTMPASMARAAVSMLNDEKEEEKQFATTASRASLRAAAPEIISPRAARKAKDLESLESPKTSAPTEGRVGRSQTEYQKPAAPGSLPKTAISPRSYKFRDLVTPLQLTTLSNQEVARHEAFYEVLVSERAYVDELQTLQVVFGIPLSKGTVLSKPDVSALLLNFDAILNTNRLFLAGIEEVLGANKPFINEVGNVFSRFSSQFKLYVSYCANNTEVLERLDEFRSSQFKFANWLDDPARKPNGKNFAYFLQLPVQRIAKYPVMLKTLLQATPESSADHKHLTEAVREYETLASTIKDRTKRVEGMRKVAEVASNIKTDALPKNFDLKQLGRYYVTEGAVRVAKGKKSEKELYWFLFSDLLLETKRPKHGKYTAVRANSLNTLLVKDIHNNDTGFDLVSTTDGVLHVTLDSRAEKGTWLSTVQQAIEAHQSAIEDSREKLQSARQRANGSVIVPSSQSSTSLRSSQATLAAPDAIGPIQRAADASVLEAENKELRERIAQLDNEIAQTRAALQKEQELAKQLR